MIRITVFHHTGCRADNLKIARRIANKVRGAVGSGMCVLIDCDQTDSSPDFLEELLRAYREDKVKYCGLPRSEQDKMRSRGFW
jgi:hypothetical protein